MNFINSRERNLYKFFGNKEKKNVFLNLFCELSNYDIKNLIRMLREWKIMDFLYL